MSHLFTCLLNIGMLAHCVVIESSIYCSWLMLSIQSWYVVVVE